jgi:hypothetical protein
MDLDYSFKDFGDHVAHVHRERVIFIAKYANLHELATADNWNNAIMRVSLQAPAILNLSDLSNAIASDSVLERRRRAAVPDESGLVPQVEALPSEIEVSVFLRNHPVGTVTGSWFRLSFVDDTVYKRNAEDFSPIVVPPNTFVIPTTSTRASSYSFLCVVYRAVGLASVLSSVVLISLSFRAHRASIRAVEKR